MDLQPKAEAHVGCRPLRPDLALAARFDPYDLRMGPGHPAAAVSEASRAQALALCTRAASAVDRAGTLYAVRWTLHAAAREALAQAVALRDLGAVRRESGSGASGATWRAPWRIVPCTDAPPALVHRDAGRVVRRSAPHRRAAASPDPSAEDSSGAQTTPPTHWARAIVYATRAVEGASVHAVGDGRPDGHSAVGTWTVREVDARAVPGARAPRCLIFENHELVRRVWDYPRAWRGLPAAALLRLAELVP